MSEQKPQVVRYNARHPFVQERAHEFWAKHSRARASHTAVKKALERLVTEVNTRPRGDRAIQIAFTQAYFMVRDAGGAFELEPGWWWRCINKEDGTPAFDIRFMRGNDPAFEAFSERKD